MYKSGRIRFDTRKYDLDEVFRRYKSGNLIFYKKNSITGKRRSKVTREVLEALLRGIPFPPVYTSELQTGELLVLDKSDRLRFLMEYLVFAYGEDQKENQMEQSNYFSEIRQMYSDWMKDIFYAPIMLHVIDYTNPKYVHMQVGAFVEEWPVTQEQSVWNVIYQKSGAQILEDLLADIRYSPKAVLMVQYQFLYFMMVLFAALGMFDDAVFQDADKFQLIEKTIYWLQFGNDEDVKKLCEKFKVIYELLSERRVGNRLFLQASPERITKYLCFMGAWKTIRDDHIEEVYENRKIRARVIDCDMSFHDISKILEFFRRGDL